ncbi:hypothetical protein K1719_023713 [Acacia pycnantha]|nr:hypothetical protein K1719_023713 [Acacia pycnantha]
MNYLETRVQGLEMPLDEISHDLAVSRGRLSNTDAAEDMCCHGSEFLSSKFWKKTEGQSSGPREKHSQNGAISTEHIAMENTYLTPHVILVNTGEDIAAKITSFCEEGARQVCILSAHGEVSSATLRQPKE